MSDTECLTDIVVGGGRWEVGGGRDDKIMNSRSSLIAQLQAGISLPCFCPP